MKPTNLKALLPAALLAAGAAGLAALLLWLIRVDAVVYLARANQWLADTVIARLGYWGVFLLMAIESSVVPLPSEIVMPPAGDLARRLPDWTLWGVIVTGTLGSLAGALVNYAFSRTVGRESGRPSVLGSRRWLPRNRSSMNLRYASNDSV